MLETRDEVYSAFEQFKATGAAKDSQDVILTMSTESTELREFSSEELAMYLKFSAVLLSEGKPAYSFEPSEFLKCERSRLRRADVELQDGVPLTKRDRQVLEALKGGTAA